MSEKPPIPCVFLRGAFHPLRRAQNAAAAHYGEGEIVRMAPIEERSEVSHRHEFAWLKDAWMSLPETVADQFPSTEHLRKRALVMTGFFHETVIDVGTKAGALRVAAFARGEDEYAWVAVRGTVVVVRKPKSQAKSAMLKEEFQRSKTAIMEWVADLIGVTVEELSKSGQGAGGANNPAREAA